MTVDETTLTRANRLLRERHLDEALSLYETALQEMPDLAHHIRFNMRLAEKWKAMSSLTASVATTAHPSPTPVQPTAALTKPEGMDDYTFERIVQSGLFDVSWYLKQYGHLLKPGENPLAHYLEHGVQDGLNPSLGFDTRYYLESNPDVAQADIPPFCHYVIQGYTEGRRPLPYPEPDYDERYPVAAPKYVPRLSHEAGPVEKAVRVIAFYLPQFHPIPENDSWWGKGFTEWTNVRPAKPQFEGHYQPHVPDKFLGYYDLRDAAVMRNQIELAKQYGIEGFCFYTYWFSGRRLLETPVDNYLADATLDLPFCICWANENWSRRWDGLDQDLLMEQHYSDEDDIAFIAHMAKYLRDERYIRVADKPLLLVYRPALFPDVRATVKRWRRWCRENGIGEIFLAYPQSFERVDPTDYRFDAAVEFPPNNSNPPNITRKIAGLDHDYQGKVYDWRVFIERSENYQDPGYRLFRGACPAWDNTARRKNKGVVFHPSSPILFAQWLTNAFTDTLMRFPNLDERLVFINAWNEWAEGAHLEPDQRYGYAWLQAVRDAHLAVNKRARRIVVVSHDAHPHGAQILCLNFARYFKEQFHFEVEMIVLNEGRLIPKFREYANVHMLNLSCAGAANIDGLLSRLRSKGAEVAIVNTTVSGMLIPHLKRHGYSVVSLVHEMPNILKSYRLQDAAEQIAAQADKVLFPARQVQEGFEAFVGRTLPQAIIRPQGLYMRGLLHEGADKEAVRISVRKQLGLSADAKLVMCVGYADHRKGFDLFVKACLRVFQQFPDSWALWVGHLDEKFVEQSLQPAVQAGLRSRFLFTGLVERPQEYYLAADVYALTSREDPFPSVVMEALDALTPVVAFKGCGGFENLLERDCGLLVPAEDHASFADALITLLQDPRCARKLAENGRFIVENELSFQHYLFDLLAYAGKPLPRVSVVVPNYRYEKYIRQRMESIVNQSLPIYELIVLDDCSPDDSVSVIRDFLMRCEVPHRLVVNEHNSGSVFHQWRKGVEMARGELVWIAEADDLADPLFLEKLTPFFDDPAVVFAYSQSKQIDENGKLLANDYLAYTNDVGDFWRQDYVVDGKEEIRRALCIKNTIPNVSGVVFRREALCAVSPDLEKELLRYKVAGDWLVYLHLAARGKVAFCSKALNVHRRHLESVTKVNNHLQEVITVQQRAATLAPLGRDQFRQMQNHTDKLKTHFERTEEAAVSRL